MKKTFGKFSTTFGIPGPKAVARSASQIRQKNMFWKPVKIYIMCYGIPKTRKNYSWQFYHGRKDCNSLKTIQKSYFFWYFWIRFSYVFPPGHKIWLSLTWNSNSSSKTVYRATWICLESQNTTRPKKGRKTSPPVQEQLK